MRDWGGCDQCMRVDMRGIGGGGWVGIMGVPLPCPGPVAGSAHGPLVRGRPESVYVRCIQRECGLCLACATCSVETA